MSNKIKLFIAEKHEANECAKWAALIGDQYHGGGGGIGALRSFSIASGEAAPTIYHQYSNGSTNYHPMPRALNIHLEAAIKARFKEILADALHRQSEFVKECAAEAVKEHAILLSEAGITA